MSRDNPKLLISMQQPLAASDDHVRRGREPEAYPLTPMGGQEAYPPDDRQPDSNATRNTISIPETGFSSDEDNIVTHLSWEEQMQLEDEKDAKHPKG